MKAVLSGGVIDPKSISPELMKEMYLVGNRCGHYRGFINLLRNSSSWQRPRSEYRNIDLPTSVVGGMEDWSLPDERRYDESLLPGVQSVTVEKSGHFCLLTHRLKWYVTFGHSLSPPAPKKGAKCRYLADCCSRTCSSAAAA